MQQLQKMMQKFLPETAILRVKSLFITDLYATRGTRERNQWTNLINIQAKCLKLFSILFP